MKNLKNKTITFSLTTDSNGVRIIDISETVRQTKRMVADQRNRKVRDVQLGSEFDEDLGYDERDRIVMKQLIEELYFFPYSPTADVNFLKKVDTVRSLADQIYKTFIPARHRG